MMPRLPAGFRHEGYGRLAAADSLLAKLKTSKDIAEVYDIEQAWMAKGMYGIVRHITSKETGHSYAAKFLRRRRRGKCCVDEINHEVAVLMLCAHSDHVVKLQAVHESRSDIALVLELATGGELQKLIDDEGHLTEQQSRVCMREILRAVQYLHSKSIVHLDLKPQNILLAGKTIEDGLKLCDFGLARFIDEKSNILEIAGTPGYVAPEVLHYETLSLKTDIWSLGVVAYVLLTAIAPFEGESKQETFLNITKCSLTFPDDLFTGISNDAIDFIKSALRIDPKERLTIEECLEHRWIKEETICPTDEGLAAQAVASHMSTVRSKRQDSDVTCDEPSPDTRKTAFLTVPVLQDYQHQGVSDNPGPPVDEECSEAATGGEPVPSPVEGEETKSPVCSSRSASVVADDNKENVMMVGMVTRSLFPDAPTTPKVSRKALPPKQLNDGVPHHHLHHHVLHGHNVLHGHHHQHPLNQQPSPNSGSSGSSGSFSDGYHVALVRQGSPTGSKNFAQLYQTHSKPQPSPSAVSGDAAMMTVPAVPVPGGEKVPNPSEWLTQVEGPSMMAAICKDSSGSSISLAAPTSGTGSTSSSASNVSCCRTTGATVALHSLKSTDSTISSTGGRRLASSGH